MTVIYEEINYICLTEFNKEKLLQLKQIQPDKVFIKPMTKFQNKPKEYYLYIGRIKEIKGVPLIIDAFRKMSVKRLMLAGTGTKLEEYKKATERYSNINFLGFVPKMNFRTY